MVDVLGSALVFLAAAAHPELRIPGAGKAELSLLIPGLVACLAWPLILEQLDLYQSQRRRDISQVLARLLLAGGLSTVLVAAAVSIVRAPVVSFFALAVGTGQF